MIGALSLPGRAGSAAYYVNSSSPGSDANDGFSPGTAFATVAKVAAADALSPRSVWNFNGSWREKIVVPRNGMAIQSYGAGALFDCSDVIATGSWSKTGGYTNIYQATLTVDPYNGSAANLPGMWKDGTRLASVADLATLDATPNTFYTPTPSGTSLIFYINVGGGAPSGGSVFEHANRASGVDTYSVTGCTLSGLTAKRNFQSYGSINLGQNCVGCNLAANEGNAHNIYIRAGASLYNSSTTDGYSSTDGSYIPVIIHDPSPNGGNVKISGVNVSRTFQIAGGVNNTLTAFMDHTDGVQNFGQITYNDCSASDTASYITNSLLLNGLNAASITVRGMKALAGQTWYYNISPTILSFTSDYNAFLPGVTSNSGGLFSINGTQYNTLSEYKAGSGQDLHSTP